MKVLNAAVGDYITIARKSADKWFIGSMTDENERELTFDLTFLDKGNYKAILFEDADNPNEFPSEVNRKERILTNKDCLTIKLAKGGGFAAILEPVEE